MKDHGSVRRGLVGTALTLVGAVALGACGGDEADPTAVPTAPVAEAVPSSDPVDLQVALASSDIAIGRNRIAFGLIDRQTGAVRDARVVVSTFVLTQDGADGPKETAPAVFRKWPTGQAGVYTVEVTFDRPGRWGLGIEAAIADGSLWAGSTSFDVKETSATPAIGASVPRSASKTAADVDSLDQLTTDSDPDPDFYAMTIADAIDSGLPSVVVFATPAYCTTSTCGPQLRVVKQLKEAYGSGVNFIHVEVWDNPHEIEGDLSRGKISPTLAEWGLTTEPWTFILEREGTVAAKFEGFVTAEELGPSLESIVR